MKTHSHLPEKQWHAFMAGFQHAQVVIHLTSARLALNNHDQAEARWHIERARYWYPQYQRDLADAV